MMGKKASFAVGWMILVVGWILALPHAQACGGLFCNTLPVDQNAERIIFVVHDDGTISAIVGINYVGKAEDFSWIVPVPSVPQVDVAETELLDTLQFAT